MSDSAFVNSVMVACMLIWGTVIYMGARFTLDSDFPWWVRWPVGFLTFSFFCFSVGWVLA